jgi:uncharacterized membrane protein YccC
MQMFAIAPAGTRPLVFLFILLVVIVGALGIALLGSRMARFEVSAEGLRLRGDLYGRFIPGAQLRRAEIRRIDLATSPELAPRLRTLGTGLPGYQAGWFRLRNGEKALLYLTDRGRAVYVPTTAGYSVLVSPENPDEFVAALRASAQP